ncbi:E3 ubiquitin-protein ligase At3g02290 isoform X2 [Brassica rapa]|uniref:E3 ubiquitin-protein ligase At3g02290 isoform X2 n=1 Tax=Brassica campestris TaxID=3711 RepID=UPI00142DA486|nr:E3 ubiquitin-protein ligase At3g02290 isoform X2 [Brassica rapa]
MGCVSSCFQVEDYEEDHTNPSSSVNRNCPCPRCLVNNLLNLYISLFRRGETPRSLPSSLQATTVSITSYDNFISSTPWPLPYDSDPGYFHSRRDSLVSRRDKGSSHSHEEAEPLRSDADDEDSESFLVERSRWANKLTISGEDSREDFSKSTRRILKSKTIMEAGSNQGVYDDDEDVCPTCLEGIHFHFESMHLKEALVSHIFFARFLKNTHQRTRRLLQSVVTITTSAAFMNGWREAKTVLFVER